MRLIIAGSKHDLLELNQLIRSLWSAHALHDLLPTNQAIARQQVSDIIDGLQNDLAEHFNDYADPYTITLEE